MLKIKDNVDLKELEKFGFEYFNTSWRKGYWSKDFKISTKKHHIMALNGTGAKKYNRRTKEINN